MDHLVAEDHTINKPRDYEHWRNYVPKLTPAWTGPLLNWTACDPKSLGPRKAYFDPNPSPNNPPGLNLFFIAISPIWQTSRRAPPI
jgi:hypothetical protein